MKKRQKKGGVGPLLRTAINTLVANKVILFPYSIVLFVQLLALEILYFIPQFPLNTVFAPIIRKLWSEDYLHFPFNIALLPKLYQYAQIPIFLFISSYLIGVSVAVIAKINSNKTVKMRSVFRETVGCYIHIVVAAAISFSMVVLLFKSYGLLTSRALMIRSTAGIYFIIKKVILSGAPYINLFFSVLVSTLFAYVIPIIIIDKRKVFAALWVNFKILIKSFWLTLLMVLIPSLLFVPILLLRPIVFKNMILPEMTILFMAISAFVMIVIDAVIYTAITTFYLSKKEGM